MEFINTIRQVKANWEPYKKWDIEQQKKEKQNHELLKKYPPTKEELEHAKQYGRTIVDVINTMDQHSIDKSEDASVNLSYKLTLAEFAIISLGFLSGLWANKNYGKKYPQVAPYMKYIGIMAITTLTNPILSIYQSKVSKQASRIARFQTREQDLKDSRNFVVYNQSQIDEAKSIAKNMPEVNENRKDKFDSSIFNLWKNFKLTKKTAEILEKDEVNYEKWKEDYLKKEALKQENFKNINPTPEELNKAEKDRDMILNTIKKIENTSLNYLNNMEMATHWIKIGVSSGFLGIGAGLVSLVTLMQKKNILPKKFKGEILLLGSLMFGVPIIGTMSTLGPMNKMLKDAARIGRFKAKQELLNNPENFIAFDEEKRNSIKLKEENTEFTKQKGLWKRFKEDLNSIKQLKKDYNEYKQYMDTTHKEELKLHEALKQVKITSEQQKESQHLKKNAFQSFEKMDEKAQRFTDDTDAAVDITRHSIGSSIGLITKFMPLIMCGKEIMQANGGKAPDGFIDACRHVFSGELKPKTFMSVVLVSFILPKFIRIPLFIKSMQIKKDAGKIGVMSAMQDLDNPKNFLDDDKMNNSYSSK